MIASADRGARTGPRSGDRRRPTTRAVARAVRPFVARGARWRAATIAAWVVGAGAGVAPTAFQGDPAPGLAASTLLGLLGVAVLAPLIVTPMVATIVGDDDHHQVAPAWPGIGVAPRRRLTARALAAARASVPLLGVGAFAGLAAGVGLAWSGRDPFLVGLEGAPGPAGVALAAGLLVLSWVVGGLVGIVAVTPTRAVLVLVLSVVLTGTVASLVYFVPGLATAFWFTPWVALWPLDPGSFESAQFVVAVPVAVRAGSASAWLVLLTALAARRLRVSPYPIPGERGGWIRRSRR